MNLSTVHTLSNTRVSRIILYGLACTYGLLLLLYVAITQFQGIWAVAILIGLYVVRHLNSVIRHPKYHHVAAVSPFIEIVLLFLLLLRGGTEIETIVFVLFVADLLLHYKAWYAIPFAYAGFVAYLLLWPEDGIDSWRRAFDLLSYSCLVISIWSTKLLLNQRDVSLRLNEALLQEARTREEMAALQERTRIAEEVHDTVGHTLTTAIVALEGAGLLFDRKPDESKQKIHLAREQLKEGLGNIRQVVKALKTTDRGWGDLGLKEGIQRIVNEAAKQTGVRFRIQYEVDTHLISLQEYVMINAIKESITNALKHGQASAIEISVLERQETIHIEVKDNGKGNDSIRYGFGLTTMEERVEAIGGRLFVQSEPMKGFALQIRMPIARGEG